MGNRTSKNLSPQERALPLRSFLAETQTHCFAIQSILSPGSPDRPRWCDVVWHAYGPCLAPYAEAPDRIGSASDSPKFARLETAEVALAAIQMAHAGQLRSRIVSRVETCHEAFIKGDPNNDPR